MKALALLVFLLSPPLLYAAVDDDDGPKFPDCSPCQNAQNKYNGVLDEFDDSEKTRDTAKNAMEKAKVKHDDAADDLRSATTLRDDAMNKVRDTQIKTDKNKDYLAAVSRQSEAVDNVVKARVDYNEAAADLKEKQKLAIAASDETRGIAKNLEAANKNVINAVKEDAKTKGRDYKPTDNPELLKQTALTNELIKESDGVQNEVRKIAKENEVVADQVTKEHDDKDINHNKLVETEIAESSTQCGMIACQTPPAPKAFIAKPGGNEEKKGAPAKETPKTDPAAPKPKDSVAAKKHLDEILKKDPGNSAALSARAMANAKLGNNSAACSDATAALRGDPRDQGALSVASLYCRDGAGGPPKNIKANAAALLAGLKGPSAFDASGPARPGPAGSAAAATPKAASSARPAAADARGANWKAEEAAADLRQGRYHDALTRAKEALRLDPRNLQGHLLMAAAYKAMGNHAGALAAAEAGLRLDPGNLALLNMKANALNHLKDYRGALFAVGSALQANATDAASYVNKAYALGGLGDKDGMLSALRTAATLDPRYNASLQAAIKAIADGDDLFALFADSERPSAVQPPRRRSRAVRYGLTAIGALASLALLASLAPFFSRRPAPAESSDGAPLIAGQYELKDKLGEGGMGIVYEAFDHNLERTVAIKKMRPELQSRPEEWDHFLSEARTVARLSHPYIVTVHDVFAENDEVYMVLDYVDGKPLSSLLAEGRRLPLEKLQSLFSFVCQAIDCAHRAQVLHRDLKPSNIMVGKDGYAKVMDFGIARQAKETLSRVTALDSSGTPAYMAPEQHMGHAVRASDIFSLEVCLYECATGKLPFSGPDFLAQKERRLFVPAGKISDGIPPSLDLLVSASLEPDPKKRISDALEFERGLRECAAGAGNLSL